MDFLKRLFGTNGASSAGNMGDPNGLYFYVRPDGCEEVVRVRIDRNNDLSLNDDNTTFIVQKHVRGVKCRQGVELTLHFDGSRRHVSTDIEHGALVKEADYLAWMEHT
jgi:hypothetical protein